MYDSHLVLATHKDKDVREIIEAQAIVRNNETCVSAPSADLLRRQPLWMAESGDVAPLWKAAVSWK